MMKNVARTSLFFLVSAILSTSAHAGLVVDVALASLGADVAPVRGLNTDTDTRETYDWSAGSVLYDGAAQSTRFYGGVSVTAAGGLNGTPASIKLASGPNLITASAVNGVIGPSQVRALYLWDAADFLVPGANNFDGTPGSSLTLSSATLFDGNATGGTRFVIRDGGTYYVSNMKGPDTSNVDVTIQGDSAGLKWAVFNPDDFASFTEDDANLGFGSVSFSAMTFTNVTGVGFIGNSSRSSFSRLEMDKFQASLFLDTSLPGYVSTPFSLVDVRVNPTNGDCTVSWEAALNQRFSVHRSSDFASWTTLQTNYPALGADGGLVSYTDPVGSAGPAFYQVSRPYDPAKKLNVLLIVVDDLRDHEEFSGNNTVQMPNLDRLASQGLKFEQAYCQATFCNPSRASFLTGLRPDTTGISNNQDFFRDSANPAVATAVTLPQCFRNNGYYTVSLGKILHHDQMDPLSWNLQINSLGSSAAGNSGTWVNMTHNYTTPLDWCTWRAPECEDDDLEDGRLAQAAIEVLQEKRTSPFFLAVGFKKPHDPFVAPKKYFDMYPLTNLVLHVDPPDASPFPPLALPSGGYMPAFNAMDDSDRLEFLRCYAACSTYVDTQIGKILDVMDALGLWQNTIVILYTDHGYHQGERGWWNKTMLDTYDAKVPLMVYVPQMPFRDVVCTGVVELVDIFPTLAELVGIQPPANLEGESFAPLIENPGQPWSGVGISQKSTGKTVCDGRFRYTEWTDGEKELFDHATDPGEWYNLASDPAQTPIMQTLSVWLQ